MEHRVPTIYEVAEQAQRKQKPQPQAGERKLKPTRKPSNKTSRRPSARKKTKKA